MFPKYLSQCFWKVVLSPIMQSRSVQNRHDSELWGIGLMDPYCPSMKQSFSHGPLPITPLRPGLHVFTLYGLLKNTYKQSRPGRSQGLLYKHTRHSLINWLIKSVSHPFPLTALQRRHAKTVKVSSLSYKIDYVIVMKSFLKSEGHQNRISASRVTVILLKGLFVHIGGVASGRVCACSLRRRLVY